MVSCLQRYLGVLGGLEEESYQRRITVVLPRIPREGGVLLIVTLASIKPSDITLLLLRHRRQRFLAIPLSGLHEHDSMRVYCSASERAYESH